MIVVAILAAWLAAGVVTVLAFNIVKHCVGPS